MDIEKLKSICEESSQPIRNMDEFPLAKALHKSAIFRSNIGPHHVLELIEEIQTLRAKVASAEVLVEALMNEIHLYGNAEHDQDDGKALYHLTQIQKMIGYNESEKSPIASGLDRDTNGGIGQP